MSAHLNFDGPLAEVCDLYLLGALEGDARAELTAHLDANCLECVRELRAARTRQAALALTAAPAVPRPEVKRRLMETIAAETTPTRAQVRRWQWVFSGLTVAFAALCLVLFTQNRTLESARIDLIARVTQAQDQLKQALHQNQQLRQTAAILASPAAKTLDVKAGPSVPAAPAARAVLDPRRGVVLIASNLSPAAPRKTYELWLLPQTGNPIPAGTFQTSATGDATYTYAQPFQDVAGVAVSLEPAGGSAQPTGPILLAAKFPSR